MKKTDTKIKSKTNSKQAEKKTAGAKLGAFLESRGKIVSILLLVISVGLLSYVIVSKVTENSVAKKLGELDAIKFELIDNTTAPSEDDWIKKFDKAKEALAPYADKGGIVGVRANLMLGDIFASLEQYNDAVAYYKAAADKNKNSYTYSLANTQQAVCYEQLKDFSKAADCYKAASEDKNNRLRYHAMLNYARVLEQQGNVEAAKEAYQKLVDEDSSNAYAMIAKTRLLSYEIKEAK